MMTRTWGDAAHLTLPRSPLKALCKAAIEAGQQNIAVEVFQNGVNKGVWRMHGPDYDAMLKDGAKLCRTCWTAYNAHNTK